MQGSSKLNMSPAVPPPAPGLKRQVVYAPACVTRMMGPAYGDDQTRSVHEVLLSLFDKAGYEVIYPKVCTLCHSLHWYCGGRVEHASPRPGCLRFGTASEGLSLFCYWRLLRNLSVCFGPLQRLNGVFVSLFKFLLSCLLSAGAGIHQ